MNTYHATVVMKYVIEMSGDKEPSPREAREIIGTPRMLLLEMPELVSVKFRDMGPQRRRRMAFAVEEEAARQGIETRPWQRLGQILLHRDPESGEGVFRRSK